MFSLSCIAEIRTLRQVGRLAIYVTPCESVVLREKHTTPYGYGG